MKRIPGAALISISLSCFTPLLAGENLLRNGDFEIGDGGSFPGWSASWPPSHKERPTFGGPEGKAHGGKGAGSIRASGPGGYSSFVQTIDDPPRDAATVRIEGWIRAEAGTAASLILIFFNPEDAKCEIPIQARATPASEPDGWARIELETQVPPCARKWMLRCGVAGAGFAAFDDLSLTASTEKIEGGETLLAVARGKFFVVPSATGRESSIAFSVPFPFGGQAPLALAVESDPPGAVARLEIGKDRDNRPLRVFLKPQAKKGPIKLRAETFTLLRDRPPPGGETPLAAREKIPADIRAHLKAAPGVEANDPRVKEIAARFSRKDLQSVAEGLTGFLRENLKYEGGGNQSAKRSIESRAAVCTGYANVAAALLIAAGVPARILACTGIDGKLQEHYIVEGWAPGPGWARIESTMATFPWPDSRNLILRVVYPDSPRSSHSVPLFFDLQGATQGGFDGDPADGCWQSAETLGRFLLPRSEAEAIDAAARKAFEAGVGKPVTGSRMRFVPEAKAIPALGERGRKLLDILDAKIAVAR